MASENEEIKTFRVGNEKVRLDELLHNIMLGADRFIRTRKESEREAIQNAYINIMNRLEKGDNTLYIEADENGNYSLYDTIGQMQDDDNNSYAKALGYIIPVMKNTQRYTDDISELEEFTPTSFGTDLFQELFGGDENNVNNFVMLDLDENNNLNGIENRKQAFLKALNKVNENSKDKYKDYNYQESIDRISSILENGLSKNEYYELGKLTGISDINKLFQTVKYSQSEQPENPYMLFQSWLEETHPYEITTALQEPIDFSNDFIANETFNEDLYNEISDVVYDQSVSVLDLIGSLNRFIQGESDLLQYIGPIMDRLEIEGQLVDLGSNLFAVPLIQSQNKGTVFVWDSKKQILKETNTHTLPYYQQLYLQEYKQLGQQGVNSDVYNNYSGYFVTYNKEGGVLKGQNGLTLPEWFKSRFKQLNLTGWSSDKDSSNWITENTPHGFAGDINKIYELNKSYTSGNQIAADIQSFADSGEYSDIRSFIEDYNTNAETIRNFWNIDRKYDDKTASDFNDLYKRMFTSRSLDSSLPGYIGFQEDEKETVGSNTWLRRMDLYEKEYADLTDEEKNARTHTITIGGKEYQVYKKANGDIGYEEVTEPFGSGLTNELMGLGRDIADEPEIKETGGIKPEQTDGIKGNTSTDDSVFELPEYEQAPDELFDFLPMINDISRYLLALGYNKDIYDLGKKSIPLNLKQPYELYSPVTGAFGEMNMYNQLAAALRRRAKDLMGADPEKNAAIAMEYNKAAALLELQGFIADNREIKRTQGEALDRQEKNIALRNTIANYNNEQINNFNAKMNELEAAYKSRNFESTNNLLKSLEAQISDYFNKKKAKAEEERMLRNEVAGQTSLSVSQEQYKNALASLQQAETMAGTTWSDKDRQLANIYKKRLLDIYKAQQLYSQYVKAGANPSDLEKIRKLAQTPMPDYNTFAKLYKATFKRLGGVLSTIKSLKR